MKNKKNLYGILALVLILVVGSIAIYSSRKITYTKEFEYIPKYKNMVSEKYEPAKDGAFGNAVYYVDGVKYEDYLKNYQKLLERDGWKVEKDNKPNDMELTKGEHILRINAVNSKDKLIVLLWTK